MPRQNVIRRSSSRPVPKRLHTLHFQAAPTAGGADSDEVSLRSRIEEVERLLREAPDAEFRRRAERRQLIPPPEHARTIRRAGSAKNQRRLTKMEKRALARERWRHVVVSAGLALLLIGLVNWVARVLQS